MKPLHVTALAIILGGIAAGGALAASPKTQGYSADAQTLCQPDMFRLCNEFVPDEDEIAACMQANRKKLSRECAKAFDAEMKKRK